MKKTARSSVVPSQNAPEAPSLPPTDRLSWITREILPYEPAVRNWLRRIALVGATPDDIIQECYARFCASNVDEVRNGRALFFQTARNLVIDHARRSKIQYLDTALGLEDHDAADPYPNPEDILDARQKIDRLRKTMLELPPICQEVFILRRIYNFSHDYIAQKLGISKRAVERHIARGLARINRVHTDR